MPSVVVQAKQEKRKGLHPIWRGIGFLMFFAILGGSYWMATLLIELNKTEQWVPPRSLARIIPFYPEYTVPAAIAIVVSLLFYSVVVLVYAIFRGTTNSPLDVRGPSPKRQGGRKIRRCR